MCGRYALHGNPQVIALQFGLDAIPDFKASYNICPSAQVLIVRPGASGRRVADRYRWGLGNKIANARGETVAEKFRNPFRQSRCLVPASGFYEWQTVAGKKRPWYLRPKDTELFALAGIAALHSVALITTEPNELMRSIHGRMPLIVAPEDHAAWLDLATPDPGKFIRPYPAARMDAYRVSLRVNTPGNDDPMLIERLDNPA